MSEDFGREREKSRRNQTKSAISRKFRGRISRAFKGALVDRAIAFKLSVSSTLRMNVKENIPATGGLNAAYFKRFRAKFIDENVLSLASLPLHIKSLSVPNDFFPFLSCFIILVDHSEWHLHHRVSILSDFMPSRLRNGIYYVYDVTLA